MLEVFEVSFRIFLSDIVGRSMAIGLLFMHFNLFTAKQLRAGTAVIVWMQAVNVSLLNPELPDLRPS